MVYTGAPGIAGRACNMKMRIIWTMAVVIISMICLTASALADDVAAGFTSNVTGGTAPLTVQFTDSSTGEVAGWAWDFGDGASSTDPSPVHTFTAAGTYTITLAITNGSNSSSATSTVTVTDPPVLEAGFTANATTGTIPMTVQFTDTSTGDVAGWEWNFGDGSSNVSVQSPVYIFESSGAYTVRLTVYNDTASSTKSCTIYAIDEDGDEDDGVILAAYFTANVTSGTVPLTVQFNDTSTGDADEWIWSFGDGSSYETSQNVTHTFSSAGTYSVAMTIANGTSSNSTAMTITVYYDTVTPTPVPLEASITASAFQGTVPLTVQFYDASTGNATSWYWNFGDGDTSSLQNPAHTFEAAGSYTVVLTVSDGSGSATSTMDVIVDEAAEVLAMSSENSTVAAEAEATADGYPWPLLAGVAGAGVLVIAVIGTVVLFFRRKKRND